MISQPTAESPFKFLDAYTAQDKDRFFGRDAEQQRLVELLFRSRLILVYGQSGTGKTSLVQCGLARALESSDYYPVLVRRRGHILSSLRATLSGLLEEEESTDIIEMVDRLGLYSMRPVYLIFDQLEELFVSGDTDEQQQFFDIVKRIYQVSSGCKLLLVMREDYIAYLYPYEELIPELFNFRLRVEPMSERGLQEVITGTCHHTERIRLLDEKETVRQIIRNNQGSGNTFQLPYLQVYLDRLWRVAQATQPGETVVFDPALVERVGAIDDVLEQFLNEQLEVVADTLPMLDTPTVKRVLEAFVTYEGTRREHRIPTLVADTGLEPSVLGLLLAQLERGRILSGDDGLYELAHDSLAKLIDKGRSAEQRQLNDILRRLKEAYAEYLEKDQATDLLLPARRLSEIQLYPDVIQEELARSVPNSEAIWQFVTDSQEELQRRQRQQIRRLRTIIAVVSGLFLLAVVAALLAVREWEKSNVKSVVFQLEDMDPLSAQVMSIWAHEKDPNPMTAGALYNTFYNQRLFAGELNQVPIKTAEFSPDGKLLVSVAGNNRVYIWDWQRQRITDSLQLSGPVLSVSVATNAEPVVVVTESGEVRVWSRRTRKLTSIAEGLLIRGAGISANGQAIIGVTDDEQLHRWRLLPVGWTDQGAVPARTAGFSPDSQTLLTLTTDGNGTLWNVATGQVLRQFTATVRYQSEAISPGGRQVLLTTKDSRVYLLDASTGTQRLLPQPGPVLSSGFSPDGKTVWTATQDSLYLWGTTGNATGSLKLSEPFRSISLSPDGQTILLVYQTNKVHLLNRDGLRLDYLSHNSPVKAAVFAPDASHILTTTEEGKGYIWSRADNRFLALAPNGRPKYGTIAPDGKQVLVLTSQGSLQIGNLPKPGWDTLPGLFPVRWAAFSSDARQVVAVSDLDGRVSQWDVPKKRILKILDLPPARFVDLSRDGSSLLAVLESGEYWLGRPDGKRLPSFKPVGAVQAARFSANGERLVVASETTCYLLDKRGTLVDSLISPESIRSAELSSDGKTVAIVTFMPNVYLWSPATRAVVALNDQEVVKTAAFCNEGRLVLTMTNRGKITIWLPDGQPIARIKEPYAQVWVASEGRQLVLQTGDGGLIAPGPDAIDTWYRRVFSSEQRIRMREEAARRYRITTSLMRAINE